MSQKLFDRRRLSFQQSIDLVFQLGQIILDGRPDYFQVDKEILMDCYVAHPAHLRSGAVLLILLTASPMISMFRTTAS